MRINEHIIFIVNGISDFKNLIQYKIEFCEEIYCIICCFNNFKINNLEFDEVVVILK